jgi:hypothetical protein
VTPDARHRGEDRPQLARRDQVYRLARDRHPARWSGRTRNWHPVGSVWLNPERLEPDSQTHGAAAALPQRAVGGGPMANTEEQAA